MSASMTPTSSPGSTAADLPVPTTRRTARNAAPARRVVLLHGIWMVGATMQWVGARLRAAGFAAETFGYHSIVRSEEHTSELQSLMRISYAVFCLNKKQETNNRSTQNTDIVTAK